MAGESAARTISARGSQGRLALFRFILEMEDNLPLVQAHFVADGEAGDFTAFSGSDVIIHRDPVQSSRGRREVRALIHN